MAENSGTETDGGGIAESFKAIESALGGALQSMARSPLYAGKTLREIHERLLPAIATRQYRLVKSKEGESVAFISWAMVSEEVLRRLSDGQEKMKLSDWQSGEIGLLADVAAADARACTVLAQKLKQEVFADKSLKAMRVSKEGAELQEVSVDGGG